MVDLGIHCRYQLFILEDCRKHNPPIKILYARSSRQGAHQRISEDFTRTRAAHLSEEAKSTGVK